MLGPICRDRVASELIFSVDNQQNGKTASKLHSQVKEGPPVGLGGEDVTPTG